MKSSAPNERREQVSGGQRTRRDTPVSLGHRASSPGNPLAARSGLRTVFRRGFEPVAPAPSHPVGNERRVNAVMRQRLDHGVIEPEVSAQHGYLVRQCCILLLGILNPEAATI